MKAHRLNRPREAINTNRSTIPSILEEDANMHPLTMGDRSADTESMLYDELGLRKSEIKREGEDLSAYDALLEFWHEG